MAAPLELARRTLQIALFSQFHALLDVHLTASKRVWFSLIL